LQNVVDALNENKAAAHGEFSLDGDSWKITCDAGYEWLDDQDPEWGDLQTSGIERSVSEIGWNGGSWTAGDSGFDATYNGWSDSKIFIAGCWQEQP
jgi:hypothetical protein